MSIHRRSTCRLCGSNRLELVLKLTPTPPANAFVRGSCLQEVYPLDVHLCRTCGHVQLLDVVDPGELFSDYVYVSGTSKSFVEHFRLYADEMISKLRLAPNDLVVEVGSNDGTMLRFLKERGCRVVGVDPAKKIAERATADGILTLPEFLTHDLAWGIRTEHGPARAVVANNVFAHIDDLTGALAAVKQLLDKNGHFVFEVQYLGDLIKGGLFDLFYHEHLSAHSIAPLQKFLEHNDFTLLDVEHVPTHGGSIRCWAQVGAGRPEEEHLWSMLSEEAKLQLDWPGTYAKFSHRILEAGEKLRQLLYTLKDADRTIVGYGAPAKATTLLYHFGLGNFLDYIVDDSPLKQGLLSPGMHIPVRSPDVLYEPTEEIDYVLILAWNFSDSIITKHRELMDDGVHFITPLPTLTVVP